MLFQGTILASPLVERVNSLIVVLLVFVLGLSMTWTFTEHWGEYYALILWAAVGMMLLVASEELLTLFLTLETMTICLYLVTAFEKDKRRSVEGGLKYFVYGSVSSALFLFGLSLLYGLTGTTSISGIGVALSSANGRLGLEKNLAGAIGRAARARRLRLQDRRGPVPPVGARRLRGRTRPGNGLAGHRLEAREHRRAHEGACAVARPVGALARGSRLARLGRHRRDHLGR